MNAQLKSPTIPLSIYCGYTEHWTLVTVLGFVVLSTNTEKCLVVLN